MSPALVMPGLRLQSVLRWMLLAVLASATVLERFGINAGALSASLALPVVYVFLVVAGAAGALTFSPTRLGLYAVCVSVALASLLANEGASSVSSLLLLVAMYLPFVFVLREGALAADDASWVITKFLDLALLCAIVGVLQFAAQVVVHASWLFDFTPYIPAPLRAVGTFNTVIPIGALNKSNGFFFREPSGFSYLMALGLIAELSWFKRTHRVLCLGLALLLTYSGTGILALVLASLYPFGVKTLFRLALLVLAGSLVFWLLGDALNLAFTVGRLNELGSESSSGYMRYVAPYRLLTETFGDSAWTVLLGHGPGTIFRTLRSYEFHDPTWAKLLFEYGAIGFLAFVALFSSMLRRHGSPVQLRAALFWGWLVMGGHLLSAEQNFLSLVLVGFMPVGALARASSKRATFAVDLPPAQLVTA